MSLLTRPVLVMEQAAPIKKSHGIGSIITTASVAGTGGEYGMPRNFNTPILVPALIEGSDKYWAPATWPISIWSIMPMPNSLARFGITVPRVANTWPKKSAPLGALLQAL
jgi:hypothetical protein